MRRAAAAFACLLLAACASGVAGPPERPGCFATCIVEMHADFAASCPKGSQTATCPVRDAIVGRARDCAEACP